MKLEVGMYVRIKNDAGWCCIGKIYNINDFREPSMKYCIDIQSDDFVFIPENMIVKASHNIIDLIEVGDVITTNNLCGEITKIDIENNKIWIACCDYETCNAEDIKSIVTSQQFESMNYMIGDNK